MAIKRAFRILERERVVESESRKILTTMMKRAKDAQEALDLDPRILGMRSPRVVSALSNKRGKEARSTVLRKKRKRKQSQWSRLIN